MIDHANASLFSHSAVLPFPVRGNGWVTCYDGCYMFLFWAIHNSHRPLHPHSKRAQMLPSYFLVAVLAAQHLSGDRSCGLRETTRFLITKSCHNHKETKAHLGRPSGLCESCLAEMLKGSASRSWNCKWKLGFDKSSGIHTEYCAIDMVELLDGPHERFY
jgi:hypothetical protein